MMKKPPDLDDMTWERMKRKLLPESVEGSLLRAAMVLMAFELLKHQVLTAPNALLMPRFDEEDYFKGLLEGLPVMSRRYREVVLPLDKKDRYNAATLWLCKEGVVSEVEAEELRRLRRYRNEVVHELAKFLIDIKHEVDLASYVRSVELLAKIGRWEARLDIEAREEYAGREFTDEEITPGPVLIAGLMSDTFMRLMGRIPESRDGP